MTCSEFNPNLILKPSSLASILYYLSKWKIVYKEIIWYKYFLNCMETNMSLKCSNKYHFSIWPS